MKNFRYIWVVGLLLTLAVIAIPLAIFWPKPAEARDNPSAAISEPAVHTEHTDIITGTLQTGSDVTRTCLTCHPDAASEMMQTTHWTWESRPFDVSWRDEPVTIGKANQINNFCIGAQGNQKSCMSCHAGYNWAEGEEYDYTIAENVDCLVCHADPAVYAKGSYGNPADGTDLLAAARSVRAPTRDNCGNCHFNGGGGNNVKHGDLDQSLLFPSENLDVHMGRENFQCTTCHTTEKHQIKGRLVVDNVVIDPEEQVACTDCHSATPHEDERINEHTDTVACQACHVPYIALKNPTKVTWDWSTAGEDRGEDHFTYLKIKGSFVYEKNVQPYYLWYNGNLDYRYLLEDVIDPSVPTYINKLSGTIDDPTAKIFPFKLHSANQPYDTGFNYFLQPITAGENGYWTNFDWDQAFELAEDVMGLPYSGSYGFAESLMYWPATHMVGPKDNAVQCTSCHGDGDRLDWQALGYPGDPMEWGGRDQQSEGN